ncbi:MAG: hypothetical protein Q9222_002722 [Ikaeria aurantiellina]
MLAIENQTDSPQETKTKHKIMIAPVTGFAVYQKSLTLLSVSDIPARFIPKYAATKLNGRKMTVIKVKTNKAIIELSKHSALLKQNLGHYINLLFESIELL